MKNSTMKNLILQIFLCSLFMSMAMFAEAQEFSFDTPKLRGKGCKEGTTGVVMSPDNQSMSIIFDEFSVEVPQFDGDNDNHESDDPELAASHSNPNLDHKVCNIVLAAKIPAGFKVKSLDISYDFRGYTFAEKGVRGIFSSVLISRSGMGIFQGRKGATQLARKNWNGRRGEVDEDWHIGSTHTIDVQSGCAVEGDNKVKFRMKNKIAARIGRRFTHLEPSGSVTMDSADIVGKMKFRMYLSPCHGPSQGDQISGIGRVGRRAGRINRRGSGLRCGRGMMIDRRTGNCISIRSMRRRSGW